MNFVVCERPYGANHAGQKARTDCRDILASSGWETIEIQRYGGAGVTDKLRSISRMAFEWKQLCDGLQSGDTLLIQFPLDAYPQVSLVAVRFIRNARRRGVRVIALVHDLDSLRGYRENVEHSFLGCCDGIIVHNDIMSEYVRKQGYSCDIVSLQIFDYLVEEGMGFSTCEGGIDIAGNLSPQKSGYIYQLYTAFPSGCFHLYGPNFNEKAKEACWYEGSYEPSELMKRMTGRFGLVWDGPSIETCEGDYGEYLRYNNPHKLSMYLALGKPVLIWSEAAEASFVANHGVGICVSSISEALGAVQSLDESDYFAMRDRARVLSQSLRRGAHLLEAVDRLLDTKGGCDVCS